ncbi:PAS domain-containing protein [Streptomyces hilarionis]|uniref:PAS domain-containing protein n=1 Tax=Streptomyces hilarionis TaxID=2839954 RepID=UPI002119CA22|nr:PAS domain-containing protein [Streptomyces hilarionis]MCQ9134720.1 PAS domain-containing protein [Streptomyces hilarionis]
MSSRPSRGAARLAAILDALPDALLLVNANGTVVNANTIALEAFETPGTALVGRGLLDLLPQFDSKLIPGSMRRPDHMDPRGRTKPTRMVARRTDGTEFPVEVTSANLENGQQAYDGYGYTSASDELLMLVVRDLSGTVDTEAELARSQRQTEMILRAASEGVVGTDTDGRIVLVNPAAAQILGYRASDLGGKELHDLVLHSRADGSPFAYDESPLADTLRSGRKHRVRGQVLWSKSGDRVAVDLTTAPVRDGDQLVGAVMTFTDRRPFDALAEEKDSVEKRHAAELEKLSEEHASDLTALRQQHVTELEELRERHEEELAAGEERYASLGEREKDRYEALAGRHEQLLTLLGGSLRGPLDELRRELAALAADDAGQLWPEANQVLHHLSAGYSRITTLIDNVLGYQRLDTGAEAVVRTKVMLDAVVAAGVDGAVDLIGPGRVQFAVHAPPIEAEVDARLLATALAHLVADVAGVDATGNAPVSAGGYMDNTVVVAAAQRGEVVRIEVRGPYAGGDPVHEPIVRGIVRAHGGVLQTHEVPGMSGSAYVLEVPLGGGAGAVAAPAAMALPALAAAPGAGADDGAQGVPGDQGVGGRRRARRSSVDAFLEGEAPPSGADGGPDADASAPTGRRRRRGPAAEELPGELPPAVAEPDGADGADGSGGTGRRRGRSAEVAVVGDAGPDAGVSEGAVVTAAEHAAGTAASGTGLGGTVPPQGVPAPGGRRARPAPDEQHQQNALPPALPALAPAHPQGMADPAAETESEAESGQPTGRRRRALAAANERAAAQEAGPRAVFALPPAAADRTPDGPGNPGNPGGPGSPDRLQASGGTSTGDGARAVGPVPVPPAGTGPLPAQGAGAASAAGGVAGPGAVHVPAQSPVPAQPGAQAQSPIPAQAPLPPQAPGPAPVPAQAPIPAQAGAPLQTAVPAAVHGVAGDTATDRGRHDAVAHDQSGDHTPPQPHPTSAPTGRRRRAVAQPPAEAVEAADAVGTSGQAGQAGQAGPMVARAAVPGQAQPHAPAQAQAQAQAQAPAAGQTPVQGQAHGQPVPVPVGVPGQQPSPGQPAAAQAAPGGPGLGQPLPAEAAPGAVPGAPASPNAAAPAPAAPLTPTPGGGTPLPPEAAVGQPRAAQPLPAEAAAPPAMDPNSTQGRAISVRTLGQGVPFTRQAAQVQQAHPAHQSHPGLHAPSPSATPAPHAPGGSGRRRKLGTPPDPATRPEQTPRPEHTARPHPSAEQPLPPQAVQAAGAPPVPAAGRPAVPTGSVPAPQAHPSLAGQSRLAPGSGTDGAGRSYAIGAPDENAAEGPEPLDGPGGAVEVADPPRPQPMDDELPPEPLDNPRRLLVWPAPDVHTQQALSDRGYRPVIVHSREEVDAQIAAFPAALFVDPLTGPITRTALQSLRAAAVAAEVPVLVTAGLGQATREAAYGADPAVLLKALAPRDSEQHPPRVLLIEEHAEIALALTSTLERRGMQVARAASDADAVTLAGHLRPNLVVMDLMQVHRRQSGILDWLRANGQLNRTPLVVYTAAVDQADLPRLASGETVLFLAERSTSPEVQGRIVDLLARIGTN